MESFQHLNLDERLSIEYGLTLDKSVRQIANILKKAEKQINENIKEDNNYDERRNDCKGERGEIG